MVDFIFPTTPGPFDTAAIQIAQARAQAVATGTPQAIFLRELSKQNDEVNANAFDDTPETDDDLLDIGTNSPLPDAPIPPSEDVPDDARINPLQIFNEDTGNENFLEALPPGTRSQQLHDLAVLQHDIALLAAAANENVPTPLSNAATTLDLSPGVQPLIGETNEANYIAPIADIVQPLADEPLTPELVQQIQTQLIAHPITQPLTLGALATALNFAAGTQVNPNTVIERVPSDQTRVAAVAPVAPIAAIEGSTIHS